ncbi:MAG: phosphoribosylformylglycinamidine cyclo-ligase [Anaerolineae bacterium]|nr:phosphoribosylformylglycinamidine cyclo-ligase [Thermoflexales bacterium]MDW8407652.1 phosphoribosylformylglycinamidine cyclo-ligase [Anaerolineae bacterium]
MVDSNTSNTYSAAGVDIAAGARAVELMRAAVQSTYGPQVLAGIGAFGGLFDASAFKDMREPVLVASTDGVGTKTMVAARMGRWDTIGQDIVNHSVNDILVQGARPLFFMDYVAAAKLDPVQIATIVAGCAVACRQAGCALLGGETAEMPGVYRAGEVDLVGTIVGVVERAQIIDGRRIRPGDVILGLPSTGLHTNGFSLARKVLDALDWSAPVAHYLPDIQGATLSVGEALLAVHRSYLEPVRTLIRAGVEVHALAHITGGGIVDNLPRVLPPGVGALIRCGTWPVLPIFHLIQQRGRIDDEEMFHVFNMGLGMLVVVPPDDVNRALSAWPGDVYCVGEIVSGDRQVSILAA